MEKYKIIAYHCKNCGAPTNPDKEYCEYCSQKLLIERLKLPKRNIRILFECERDFIYFDEILSLDTFRKPETLDATTLGDTTCTYISRQKMCPEIGITMPLTQRGRDLFYKIKSGNRYNTRIEVFDIDKAFEINSEVGTSIPEFKVNELPTARILLSSGKDYSICQTVVPENCTCPNCGAVIRSRYGACDYCGGWVEWSF